MEMLKEKIITLFYIEHLKVKEIDEKINISSAYVTKIIKKDTRYARKRIQKSYIKRKKKNCSK